MTKRKNVTYPKLKKAGDKDNFKPWLDEFRSSKKEANYRHWSYPDDQLLIRNYILYAIIVIFIFLIVDLNLHELSVELYPILAGRIILILVFASIYYLISKLLSINLFDYTVCFAFFIVSLFELFVIYSLPKDFLLHLGVDIIIIFLCYIANPVSVLKKMYITFTFSFFNLLMLFYYKENTYQITYSGYTITIVIANFLGYLISVQQGRLRRTNFLHLIKERKALEEIKTLKGVIPICSYCRNIRDDRGAWKELESYIDEHLDAQFSHGICPNCITDVKAKSGLDVSKE